MSGAPPGVAPASKTARPADKGADQGIDPALIRRTVDGIVAVAGVRRKEAREKVRAYISGGAALSDIDAWLRQTFRLDPTGVTAVRNAMRGIS